MLDAAGYARRADGRTFSSDQKTSTKKHAACWRGAEQQSGRMGLRSDIRSFEFATVLQPTDERRVPALSFALVGANEDPDIFYYAFHSSSFRPNTRTELLRKPGNGPLIDEGRSTVDRKSGSRFTPRVQQILARDLPNQSLVF